MIPKIIHYCWFGRGEMPKLIKKCIRSWKRCCRGYELRLWNEDSFDISSAPLYVRQAYEAKKWAFVSDYVRLKALVEVGGVYLDTDQELFRSLNPFLKHEAFMGYLVKDELSGGVMGAVPKHPFLKQLLEVYENRPFLVDGKPDLTTNTVIMTQLLEQQGLRRDNSFQQVAGVTVYPQTYFCPTECVSVEHCISIHTVSIHHFAGTWRSEQGRKNIARAKWHSSKRYKFLIWLRYLPNRVVRKIFGDKAIDQLKKKLGK